MSRSFALALAQIRRPTFWHDFKACDRYEDKNEKKKVDKADNDALREEVHQRLIAAGKPVLHAELVKQMDSSTARISFLVAQLFDQGKIKRHFVIDTLWVAATEHADFSALKKAKAESRFAQKQSASIRAKILDAIKAGHHHLAEIEKTTRISHSTISKYVTIMRSEGVIVATQVAGSALLRLEVTP